MTADDRRLACLTLDLENNWEFEAPGLRYATFEHLEDYVDLLDALDLPLSVFVVGETVEERPDALDRLADRLDVEFHLHSYSHDLSGTADLEREVRLGRAAFESHFGRPPAGYRATQGRIDPDEFRTLESAGFLFDSSVFPSYRPGTYNNLDAPIEPYRPAGSDSLLEIPVGVLPGLRVPVSQAYLKAAGTPLLALLRHLPLPEVVVFNTHLQDLYHTPAHERLGAVKRLFYGRNMDRAEDVFRRTVRTLRRRGYSFVRMTDVYDAYTGGSGPARERAVDAGDR
jgi:peptidoglycan/xylan/chitin deacetylase (PgdA/CDA1 family)